MNLGIERNLARVTHTILRAVFGAIFITTSIGKLLDNRAFAHILATYRLLPPHTLLPLSLTISLGELYLGILLCRGRHLKGCSVAVALINTGYLILALTTLMRGIPISNCGCFGIFFARPLSWGTVVEDGVLLALALIFLALNHSVSFAKTSRGTS